MTHDKSLTAEGAADLGEEIVPWTHFVDSSEGDSVELDSDPDVQEMVKLLDQVWPRHVPDQERVPRRFGRFSIKSELGRGGFGVVYLAEDPLLKRWVALKLPQMGILSGTESWRRFLREAQAASRLDHPNLIPLLEADTIGSVGYIVSAYVPGPSLEQWLRHQESPASGRWAAQLVAALARAIDHAHERGILHRDLKPANIMMYAPECAHDGPTSRAWEEGDVESWVPRICDFGMAKLREVDGDETRSRIVCGSPAYMAPEQAEARQSEIAAATDVYGLGAVLYQILTGRPPFAGNSDLETLSRVVGEEPAAPRKLRPGLPRDLETICLKCLAKNPCQRYSSAAALADDLERYLDGRPIQARPVAAWERCWRWARRHPALAALVSALIAGVAAGIAGLIWHDTRLAQVNEKLGVALIDAESNAREASVQKSRVEGHERLLKRQLAVDQVFGAQQAMTAKDFERALRMLRAAEPEFGAPGNREFAWSFLRERAREQFEVLNGPSALIWHIVAAPDDRTLAVCDDAGGIQLWDLHTGEHRSLQLGRNYSIYHAAFSPDGRELAVATTNGGESFLWDVASGCLRGALPGSAHKSVSAIVFSSDSRRLGVLAHQPDTGLRAVDYWDVRNPGGTLSILDPKDDSTTLPDFTDVRLRSLADLMDGRSPSWPGSLADLRRSWLERPPRGIERTQDHTIGLIAHGDGDFGIYHVDGRLRMATGRIHAHGCVLVLFDNELLRRFVQPAERVALERLAQTIVPYAAGKPVPPNLIVKLGIRDPAAAFSLDGSRLAVWNEDDEDGLKIFDLATGLVCATFDMGPLTKVQAMTFTRDGATLAFGGVDSKVRLWHTRPPVNPVVLNGHAPKETWSLAFSHDGHTLASGGDDHFIRLWNPETGEERAVLRGHNALVTSVDFASDGRTLASASFDVKAPVALWDVPTGTLKSILRGHTARARAVSFSPDGRTLASGSNDRSVIVWDVQERHRVGTFTQGFGATCIRISPDGRTVVSGDMNRVIVTDLFGGTTRQFDTGTTEVHSLVYSRDGSQLTTGHEDGLIKTWDVSTGHQTQTITGHSSIVFGLALSPDGRALASAGEDRTVRVWDFATGQELLCLRDCKARVNAVAFSPDGLTLAAADHTGAITLWRATASPPRSNIPGPGPEKGRNPGR
jgi:eukaryotic-like serine/threonine-protein kinase